MEIADKCAGPDTCESACCGNVWVGGDASVYGGGRVSGDGVVGGNTVVRGQIRVTRSGDEGRLGLSELVGFPVLLLDFGGDYSGEL